MPRIGHSQPWTFEAPFIVRGAALDKELKPHQSLINVWISGFDWNETVCSKGRASWPLPKAAVLRNAMLKYAPDGVQELEPGNDAYNKFLKDCRISGMAAVSRNSGSEPYSAGTLRYTLHGSRSFIFAYVHHIVEYLEHEKDPLVLEPSTVDLSNALKFLDSEGANALRAHGLQLHKATLREGELMYTPPGMWLLDFSDGATRSFFVQASVIKRADAESAVAKSLLSLTKANINSLKVMNDDTEILKVTKFHDAMIRSITGQPGHLYAGEALSGLLAAAAAGHVVARQHEKDPLVREPSTLDLSNALKLLDSEGANALRAHRLQLHKATLREGELMYTPPGMYTLREGLRTL